MNKCTKCGTEFEGKFCPECGTPANGKPTCPRCGSEVAPTAKFCANCGCNLSQPGAQEQQAVQVSAPVQTVQNVPRQNEIVISWRKLLRYLPMVFFALWAVLLWAFYASNVINGDGFLMDTANLYQVLENDMMVDMFATTRALIAFAVIADVYAVVLGWTSFKARGLVGKIVNYASFAFHLVIVICAGVLSGQCKQFFDGFDDYNGNFAAVVISLTVVFAVLQAGAILLNKLFGDNTPVVKQNVVKKQRKHFTKPTFMIKAGIWMRLHKVQATIISVTLAATLVAAVVLCTVLPITLGNIFRIDKVNQINLGDTPEQVEEILGEPYQGTSDESTYNYYSKNAVKILDQMIELSKQAENLTSFDKLDQLLAQEEKLEGQFKLLDYKQIIVDFDDGKVSGLRLDTHVGKLDAKQINNIYLGNTSGDRNKTYEVDLLDIVNGTVPERIEFSDGSYFLGVLPRDLTISDVRSYGYNGNTGLRYPASGTISWTNDFGRQSKTVPFDSSNIDFTYTVSSNQLSLDGTILTKSFYDMFGMELPWAYDTITSVHFGKDVEYIPDISQLLKDASQLQTVEVDPDNANYTSHDGLLLNKDMSQLLYIPPKNNLTSTDWYIDQPDGPLYVDNMLWTYKGTMPQNYQLTVQEGVTEIMSSAFANQTNLTAVTIPSSVTRIGESAFNGCGGLQTVKLARESQLQSIGDKAFYDCNSLTSITIPSSVTEIGGSAFAGCSSLQNVYYGGTINDWCKMSFDYSASPMYNASHFYIQQDSDWQEVTELEIPEGVTDIGNYQFDGFSNVTSITIPRSVTRIGTAAFRGCSSLMSITIPNSVIIIDADAFYNCSSLTIYCEVAEKPIGWRSGWNRSSWSNYSWHVVWSCLDNDVADDGNIYVNANNVKYILKDDEATVANNSCSGNIIILSQVEHRGKQYPVTTIDDYAFSDCSSLTSITIPSSVTRIGSQAFRDCSSLQTVIFDGDSQLESIGSGTFEDCSGLTSIIIPSSVTSIGYAAFSGCNKLVIYSEVTEAPSGWDSNWKDYSRPTVWNCLENDVATDGYIYTIVNNVRYALRDDKAIVARNNCSGSITILSQVEYNGKQYPVTTIDQSAFENCRSLTSIAIPSSVTSIGYHAFYYCPCLQKVTFDDDSHLQSIGSDAFSGCNLLQYNVLDGVNYLGNDKNNYLVLIEVVDTSQATYKIPESTKIICNSAFSGCDSLTSITIPSSVTIIGSYAFKDCRCLTIYCEAAEKPNEWNSYWNDSSCPVVWNCSDNDVANDGYIYIIVNNVRYALKDNEATVAHYNYSDSVTIPFQVEYKGEQYPVTSIGDYAFRYCSSLTSITIPSSVTSIGDYAFSSCYSLTSITIPSSIANIGDHSFYSCDSLQTVTFDGGSQLQIIGGSAFSGCDSLTSITIPESVISIDNGSFYECYSLQTVTFDGNSQLQSMGGYAFSGCSSMTSITIPQNVTSIGSNAFNNCDSLQTVIFEGDSQLQSMSDDAFSGCNLLQYNMLDGMKYLGNDENNNLVLMGVVDMTQSTYKIHESTKIICNSAFVDCDSLTSITIPSNVTSIGRYAFRLCESLQTVTFAVDSQLQNIGDSAFYKCSSLTSITLPSSVTNIGNYAFSDCNNLQTVTFDGDSQLQSIGGYAFSGCSSMTSITIPQNVTSIGSHAFNNCDSLTSITIPNSVTNIGGDAFYGRRLIIYCEAAEKPSGWDRDWTSSYRPVVWNCLVDDVATDGYIYTVVDNVRYKLKDNKATVASFIYSGSITIPSQVEYKGKKYSVTTIGESAFSNCTGLTSIIIPSSITSIGTSAFWSCNNLLSVTFENPNGWRANRTSLTLNDPTQNAQYLRYTYRTYTWTRS